MTETKSSKREDYENDYEYRRYNLWKTVKEEDDLGYPNIISFFCKRKNGQKENSYVEYKPSIERYDKSYDINLVIALMKNKMLLKEATRLPSGNKKRVKMRKSFLEMKEYEKYTWISLQESVRYAVRNGEDTILLSNKEIRLIGG